MQRIEMRGKIRLAAGADLDAGQHPAVVRAMVAVVEQADVPSRSDGLQELEQGTGPFGKFETIEPFVGQPVRRAAHHVAHVQLGHFVVGHVPHDETRFAHAVDQGQTFRPALHRQADEHLCSLEIAVAVIELGDAASAQKFTEFQKGARRLVQLHRQQCFALRAQLGAFRHVPQAVEIHVGTAIDGHEGACRAALAGDIFLDARDGQCAGRFDDGPGVLEDVLDAGAQLIRGDQQDLVDIQLRQPERFLPHAPHRDAVGEDAHALERHTAAAAQGFVHARGIFGLDTDDLDARIQSFRVGSDARDETAPAHRHEDRVDDVTVLLTQDLHGDRALARDHLGIVERMDEDHATLAREDHGTLVRLIVVIAVQDDLGAELGHRAYLDLGRGRGHDDQGRDAACLRGEGDSLRMVSGGRADHSLMRDRRREMGDLVVGAADLEREHGLQVLALEQDPVLEAP